MADGQLVGHAHAAVQLDGLAADEAGRARGLHLRRPHGTLGARRVVVERLQRRVDDGPRLLAGDAHVDEPVLQHLEFRQRLAELLAGLEILDGRLRHRRHGAARLRTNRDGAAVDQAIDHAEHVGVAIAEPGVGRDLRTGEG